MFTHQISFDEYVANKQDEHIAMTTAGPNNSQLEKAWAEQMVITYNNTLRNANKLHSQLANEVRQEVFDMVNHPPHYTQGGIECIDAIKAALGPTEFNGYLRGNAIKYLWRAMQKGAPTQDLDKAIWYINRLKTELSNVE
jgi:hypothetical protein